MKFAVFIYSSLIVIVLANTTKVSDWTNPVNQIKVWWLNQRGQQLFRLGEPEKALKAFQQAKKLVGENAVLKFNEGTSLVAVNRLNEAEDALRSAVKDISSKRDRALVFYNLGNLYFAKKNWKEAQRAYKFALRLNPYDRDAKFNLELVLRHKQKSSSTKQDRQKKKQEKPRPLPPPPMEREHLKRRLKEGLKAPWSDRDW